MKKYFHFFYTVEVEIKIEAVDKKEAYEKLEAKFGLGYDDVAYIGTEFKGEIHV